MASAVLALWVPRGQHMEVLHTQIWPWMPTLMVTWHLALPG